MQITYPAKEADVAELFLDGTAVRYRIPPAIGAQQEVFSAISSDKTLKVPQGGEIVAYAHGALVYKKNEWADQNRIRFPTQNYLWFPLVLTNIPRRKEFGDLEGGMLVDCLELEGKNIEEKTEIPKELAGWKVLEGGILTKDKRIFVPYDLWYKEQWDENNGAVIAICGGAEGAQALARTAKDSKRDYKPLWKVDVNKIEHPEKRVPVLDSYNDSRLNLGCDSHGYDGNGCASGVLK
jgi:hypothetical protein